MTEDEIRADERKRIAEMVADFSWVIPFYTDKAVNEASDDSACMVQEQIAAAILAISGGDTIPAPAIQQ